LLAAALADRGDEGGFETIQQRVCASFDDSAKDYVTQGL
jgi:hypothetical protein